MVQRLKLHPQTQGAVLDVPAPWDHAMVGMFTSSTQLVLTPLHSGPVPKLSRQSDSHKAQCGTCSLLRNSLCQTGDCQVKSLTFCGLRDSLCFCLIIVTGLSLGVQWNKCFKSATLPNTKLLSPSFYRLTHGHRQ